MGEGSDLVSPLGTLASAVGSSLLDLFEACSACQSPLAGLVVVVIWDPPTMAPPAASLIVRGWDVGEIWVRFQVFLALSSLPLSLC